MIIESFFSLIYINDIVKGSSVLKLTLFADDTNITFSGTDTGSLIQIVNLGFKFVTKWLYVCKLSLIVI